ncbi:hypothetical protein E4633_06505 [Geomonas terrae]|uniref:Uncharacterized protein n=1 Tax=Geomonas terrae TaxID=2562681 RepID=A0A4S1CP40_9BACT|nr:hypothetical protein [Geomonas terrae]TGU75100.1 hypothetical protein E4633_06505 [Geomonas terrae]
MQKIEVYAHTIENLEKTMNRAESLLCRLADRCHDAGLLLDAARAGEKECLPTEKGGHDCANPIGGAKRLLYELDDCLTILANNLEGTRDHISEVRENALKQLKQTA